MGTFRLIFCAAVAASFACAEAPPAETRSAALSAGPHYELEPAKAALPETDDQPLYDLVAVSGEQRTLVAGQVAEFFERDDRVYFIDAQSQLHEHSPKGARLIAEHVNGRPAFTTDGAIVVSVITGLGESELVHISASNERRFIAQSPGPDDSPVSLPDGRVLFVSARTSIASLWVVDLASNGVEQITNVGLKAGGSRKNFVPNPESDVTVEGSLVRYSAQGQKWRVDLATKVAEVD